jgi:hypothetical protein
LNAFHTQPETAHFLKDDARRFLASAVFDFSSETRFCRILAYSAWGVLSVPVWSMANLGGGEGSTYSSILGRFCLTALERKAVTLMLEALRRDETLDLGCLGVWLLTLLLGLDFATDDELADL